jgi:hypothetical protein
MFVCVGTKYLLNIPGWVEIYESRNNMLPGETQFTCVLVSTKEEHSLIYQVFLYLNSTDIKGMLCYVFW